MEMLERYKKYFSGDRFASANGIEIVDCRPGYCKTQVSITQRHLNGADVVHGGLYFTLADLAVAVATNTYGKIALSVNSNISFFKSEKQGVITAEATEISHSNRLASCDVKISNAQGELLAQCTIMCYLTQKEIQF